MEDNYIYKTRLSLWNLDFILLAIVDIFAFFINIWLGIALFVTVLISFLGLVGTRLVVYEDRVEYKAGFIIKSFVKVIPLNAEISITYGSDLFGKIFNYGDIHIGAHKDIDSFYLKNVRHAKMLCDNIKQLIYNK
jgi:hypothetical protein